MIKLNMQNSNPIHEQISNEIKRLIIGGLLSENEQLPSVRELSVSLTVNPNTVQRAYRNLESEGIIYSVRGKGSFVAKPKSDNREHKEELYKNLENAVRELQYLGEKKEKITSFLNNIFEERNGLDD